MPIPVPIRCQSEPLRDGTRGAKVSAMPKPHVSLRINCPLPLYEKIGAYRHEARHETRAQAMVTLLAAGPRCPGEAGCLAARATESSRKEAYPIRR